MKKILLALFAVIVAVSVATVTSTDVEATKDKPCRSLIKEDCEPTATPTPEIESSVNIHRPKLTCGTNHVKFEGVRSYKWDGDNYIKFIINGREPEVFYGDGNWWTGELTLIPGDYKIRAELWGEWHKKWHLKDSQDGEFTIDECEADPTPTPEPTATPSATPTPRQTTPAGAPVCQDSSPATVPTNIHVVRSGSDATVNFFTDSSNANIYFRTSGQSEWEHALRDIPVTDGYVSVTIHDLNPTGDYDFGVESANGCAGSGRVIAVVVDDFSPRTFLFTHYEELN